MCWLGYEGTDKELSWIPADKVHTLEAIQWGSKLFQCLHMLKRFDCRKVSKIAVNLKLLVKVV